MKVRPCIVDKKAKAIFHCWGAKTQFHTNNILSESAAIVEFEDGSVRRVEPERVRFCDEELEKFQKTHEVKAWEMQDELKNLNDEIVKMPCETKEKMLNDTKAAR